jgi:endonuclease/exonuclease/phosphatase family metal-dependent hydrolase
MKASVVALVLALSACVELPGQPPRGIDQPLRIATWNMEHLAERDGEGCRPRAEADYATLRRYVTEVNADVIAFQEVESKAAAERVFPRDDWTVVIEDRSGGAQGGCRGLPGQVLRAQKVGFAIRNSIPFDRNADLRELGLGNDGLRWGVDVTVNGDKPLRLLSVHLKSGCNSGRAPTDRDCDVLFAQLPVLERWIDARANEPAPFAVLGDWNRRVASRGDAFWVEIDDAEPANADLTLAAGKRGATCKMRYSEFIDHIALDARAAQQALPGSFAEYTYRVPEAQHPSDHCPVSVAVGPASAR